MVTIKENALDLIDNFDLTKETIEFISDNIWKEIKYNWCYWNNYFFSPIDNKNHWYSIPLELVDWLELEKEEDEETEELQLDENQNKPISKKWLFVFIWIVIIISSLLIWNYFYNKNQEEIKLAKQEIEKQEKLTDKYSAITLIESDVDKSLDQELRNQEEIKKEINNKNKELQKSYNKVKDLKLQKEALLNKKINLTNDLWND